MSKFSKYHILILLSSLLFVLSPVYLNQCATDEDGDRTDDDISDGDDDISLGDDDDETTEESTAPEISNLSITCGDDPQYGGLYMLFEFHYTDSDGDVVGGHVNIYLDGRYAGSSSELTEEIVPDPNEGDIGFILNSQSGLPGNSTFEFGVSLVDAGNNESNILSQESTTPDW